MNNIIIEEASSYYEKNSKPPILKLLSICIVSKKLSPRLFLSKRHSINKTSFTPKLSSASEIESLKTSRQVRKTEKKASFSDSISKLRRTRKLRTKVESVVKNDPNLSLSNEKTQDYPGETGIPFDVVYNEVSVDNVLKSQQISQLNTSMNQSLIHELDTLKHKLKTIFQSLSKSKDESLPE